MAKTEETLLQERAIYLATAKTGVFGCFEVTLGFNGSHSRVDYMTMDTKGIFRCYEVKVTYADFKSKAALSFVGHYNYFVMPRALYDKVQSQIPAHIGVYCGSVCTKRAKKQELTIDKGLLKDCLLRSLYRETQKIHREDYGIYEKEARRLRNELERISTNNDRLNREINQHWFFLHENGLQDQYKVWKENR